MGSLSSSSCCSTLDKLHIGVTRGEKRRKFSEVFACHTILATPRTDESLLRWQSNETSALLEGKISNQNSDLNRDDDEEGGRTHARVATSRWTLNGIRLEKQGWKSSPLTIDRSFRCLPPFAVMNSFLIWLISRRLELHSEFVHRDWIPALAEEDHLLFDCWCSFEFDWRSAEG